MNITTIATNETYLIPITSRTAQKLKMKERFLVFSLFVLVVLSFVKPTWQLECYVCQNQTDNKSKCTETVKICDVEQEQCLTEVRWGSIPYWALTSQKQYYVSKRCATKRECNDAVADRYHKCDRIWYNDWNCTTCCSGDKCNYYVTLAGTNLIPVPILTVGSAGLTMLLHYLTCLQYKWEIC